MLVIVLSLEKSAIWNTSAQIHRRRPPASRLLEPGHRLGPEKISRPSFSKAGCLRERNVIGCCHLAPRALLCQIYSNRLLKLCRLMSSQYKLTLCVDSERLATVSSRKAIRTRMYVLFQAQSFCGEPFYSCFGCLRMSLESSLSLASSVRKPHSLTNNDEI